MLEPYDTRAPKHPNNINTFTHVIGEPTPPNSESDTGGLGYYKNARQSLPVENGGPAVAVAENMPTTPQMFKPITPETDKDTSGENFVTSVIAGKREHPFILNIPSNNGNVKNNSSSSESESRSRFFGFMSSGGAKSQRIKDKTGHHKPTLSENPMFVSSMNINTLIAESNIALKSGGIRSSDIVGSSIIGGSGAGNGNGNSSEDFAVGDSQVGWSLPPNVA
ncbi:hypothetical protein AX774_g4040 [Zancudomyces culisetae]|uniref:Uncharacterized protein n=1 Tax=Zancudomyces culisetae TaxID=1213189 RepID=A0A1R1PNF6_ZANCU|nr:hypothetical protein AX774_g8191 [Zancudomyces culisetae]OMH82471.1 hypothetical protein AX774_g4040 [Zancudomyces culisetae]|eukprot:OMH78417.1 hypothetical protein AX774_g8191 [Zancudomyces culisetae]